MTITCSFSGLSVTGTGTSFSSAIEIKGPRPPEV
jgi:hypothetical protein